MTQYSTWDDVKAQRPTSPARRAAARAEVQAQIAGHQLAELRKSRGLTQQAVAEAMGVSQRRVSAIESGDLTHSQIGTLHAYIAALGGHITINAEFDEQTTRIA